MKQLMVALVLGLVACGGRAAPPPAPPPPPPPPVAVAATPVPPAPQAPAPQADPTDDDELQISRELVKACPELRMVYSKVDEIDPEKLWVVAMLALGHCLVKGPLADHGAIGVSGGDDGRAVIHQIMEKVGVEPDRVRDVAPLTGNLVRITLLDGTETE